MACRTLLVPLALLFGCEHVNAFTLGGAHQSRARAVAPRQAVPLAQESTAAPAAFIEFIVGVPEPCVPDVKLTRSRDGTTGVATFTFDNPSFLAAASQELGETTGMYLKDSEGTIQTSEVTANFINGKPRIVKGVIVMRGEVSAPAAHSRSAPGIPCLATRLPSLPPRPPYLATASSSQGLRAHALRPRARAFVCSQDEWDRFMRFMERYAESNGLGFNKA